MVEISLEKLIALITTEVLKELRKRGVRIDTYGYDSSVSREREVPGKGCEKIDMTGFKTPVVTERQLLKLKENTGRIRIPEGTIITPKAKEILKRKGIGIEFEEEFP